MTVLATADIRGFYRALGIELPSWSTQEAPTRCFADPDAHRAEDRHPSTSVNLSHGAWCCHGCGAAGGAYDAALAVGHAPRDAVELMIRHGLIEPRADSSPHHAHVRTATERSAGRRRDVSAAEPRAIQATNADVQRWHTSLSHRPALLERLAIERGWRFGVLCKLQVGVDGAGRITIPIRTAHDDLRGVLRYQPWHTSEPKMLAIRGTRLGLIPHPCTEPARNVVLVEGPADMIAARSAGIAAIAVPGASSWRSDWSALLAERTITVVMDCDTAGRSAAERIAADLHARSDVSVLDLDPTRDDGYDLSDALQDRAHTRLTLPSINRLTGDRGRSIGHVERELER
jgi:hypothetical protein